jgi:hypothetical protein
VKSPLAPHLDERRAEAFAAELRERAQAWIPAWGLADGERDFGRALLEIAARFSSEVAERLDGAGDKMRRGFLDWLGVPRTAARPARLPVVFKLADTARTAVLASAPVQMQADAGGTSVVFETEKDVRVVPGRLDMLVGADADTDAFYLPPPGLSDLKPLASLPTQWRVKSFAPAGTSKVQLDPEIGLVAGMILAAGRRQYTIVQADKNLVTLEPPLVTELTVSTAVSLVSAFAPFDGEAHNWQEHALYLGDAELLNIEAAATIEVVGASALREGIRWEYSGKSDPNAEVGWLPFAFDDNRQKIVNDAIVLTKPKGAIEQTMVAGNKSRWIRACASTVDPTKAPYTSDEFSIRVNADGCNNKPPCPPAGPTVSPPAEGMANTTPLVLDNVFFPLGKEPRQFDAFYIGSQEAFSKKAAQAQLCFEMADPTFFALSAVCDGVFANTVLAGVAKDRALHLMAINPTTGGLSKFREREPLQPPAPGYDGKVESAPTVALDAPFPPPGPGQMEPRWRPPVWAETDQQISSMQFSGFLVAVSAGDAISVWHEHSLDPHKSGWIAFGSIPPTLPPATSDNPVAGLVYLAGASPKIVALRNGQMAVRDWPNGPKWDGVPTTANGNLVRLEAIVPVLDAAHGFTTSVANGMVGVSDGNLLYTVSHTGVCNPLPLPPANVDFGVRPVAVQKAANDLIIAYAKTVPQVLGMHRTAFGEGTVALIETSARAVGLEVAEDSTDLLFFATVVHGDEGYLASWAPHTTPNAQISYSRSVIPAGLGTPGGVPTEVSHRIFVPGTRGDSFTAAFDRTKRIDGTATLLSGIILPSSALPLVPTDLVTRMNAGNTPEEHFVQDYGNLYEGETFHVVDTNFTPTSTGPLLAYKASAPLTGKITGSTAASSTLELQKGDREVTKDSWLRINASYYQVTGLDQSTDPWVATVTLVTGVAANTGVPYSRPQATGGKIATFTSLTVINGTWDASLLKRSPVLFPGAVPEEQNGKAFGTDAAGRPLVALAQEFTQLPVIAPYSFIVDATIGDWSQIREDTSANPELSWEYWNGKAWWKLHVTLDDTQNLKTTGALQFDVPSDISSTDWAGKANYWIRARLIGGDYGREKVTVTTTDKGKGVTEQTINRSTDGIRPPSVLKLTISYQVCQAVRPAFVISQDSRSFRDQSEANRTSGASIEAFVPLALTLGRLSHDAALPVSDACPPECDDQLSQSASAQVATGVATATTALPMTGRALFIGLTGALSGADVNVLLLCDERNHASFAPITIEALVADRFVPVVTKDTTRALGETGLLSMAFAVPPTPAELFGQPLTWLRLTPKPVANSADWKPSMRGAYLNAVWASATETLTRELLGSSDGMPNMSVRLARPPVLYHTLELRVKEPLGEEERAALLAVDAASVLSAVEGLPGDWVLWKQVADPSDEAAHARVYAFDEPNGVICFGDGRHGLIPPIGRDSIVAFSYQRTEPGQPGSAGVPGNSISARTPLNLVSPVETVESVIAAAQSAGGAPSEDDERLLRFGYARLWHRGRAITLHDLEDLTLESSSDIAQALVLARQGHARLVVVMAGKNPTPSAAQRRELYRYLLDAAPAALGATNALRIAGPVIRRLRLDLTLRVTSLDNAAALSDTVERRLVSFFDTSSGGVAGDGWPLGANPSEDDIAYALVDAPYLESIKNVALREIASDGSDQPWPRTLKPNELAMLAADPLRIQFESSEAAL